eukprot:356961-Chlamydomonas_euryale.AAC.2
MAGNEGAERAYRPFRRRSGCEPMRPGRLRSRTAPRRQAGTVEMHPTLAGVRIGVVPGRHAQYQAWDYR